MQFANVRALKVDTAKVLALSARAGGVMITRRGRPIAILKRLDADEAWRAFPRLWRRLREAAKRAGYGPRAVEGLIADVRKGR